MQHENRLSDRRESGGGFLPVMLIGGALVLWSLLAWTGYAFVDVLSGWLSSNATTLLQTGKDAATATGIGKEAAGWLDVEATSGLARQLLDFAVVVAKPAIVMIWALGALVIVAIPAILRRLGRLSKRALR